MYRTLLTIVPLALLALSVPGCASNTTDLPSLGAALTGPPGVLKSPEQQVTEQATAAISHYYEVLTRVTTGGPADELGTVAAAPYLDQLRREIDDLRRDTTITGTLRAGSVSSVKVVAPQDDQKAPIPGQAQAEMRVCEDRSRLAVTGRAADALPPPTRLRRFVLINSGWPQGQWVITNQFAMPGTDCTKPY